MSFYLVGYTATGTTTAITKNYLVATNADAADIRLDDRVILTNSGGTLKEQTVFTVYDMVSAFGFTNIYYLPNSAAFTVTGDIMKVVGDEWMSRRTTMPIGIRLVNSATDVRIEEQVRDLTFRSSIPGGFASATISLDRPLSLAPPELELFTSVYVYDTRNAETLWEGTLEDPGRGSSTSGEIWELSAIGPAGHAKDAFAPYIFIDRSMDRWQRSGYSTVTAATDNVETTVFTPALQVSAEDGTPIPTTWRGDWIYRSLFYTGQRIGRLGFAHTDGKNDANFRVGIVGRTGAGAETYNVTQAWSIAGTIASVNVGSGTWPTAADVVSIRTQRDTSSTTGDSSTWSWVYNLAIRAQLLNADGTTNTNPASYAVDWFEPVLAVADLLGRFLPRYDGANADLQGSGAIIDQLAYPDGASPAEILDDLMVYEPAYYWAAWETNPLTGKYRFEFVPWPTTVRYEATTFDGFNSPGSAADLYNKVVVRYLDPDGEIRAFTQTQTVAGLTWDRTFYIDLSDETGSDTNAATVAANFLEEHRYPPNAGTLTVARPILDNDTGRMVYPWEIKPGGLIRVSGVVPRVDSLNPSARDGVTVFKVVSVDFSTSTGSATLELDSYSRTVARALASLQNRRLRKR
jgi:hypothetical protein